MFLADTMHMFRLICLHLAFGWQTLKKCKEKLTYHSVFTVSSTLVFSLVTKTLSETISVSATS